MERELDDATETRVRSRTRKAIVDAAISVLADNPSAALADVAAAADVGRTTVHRYFPERTDLIAGVCVEVLARLEAACARARIDEGPATDALLRLTEEYYALGDVLGLIFSEPQLQTDEFWAQDTTSAAIAALVRRGQEAHELDAELDVTWVMNVQWALLYTARAHVREQRASQHAALRLCLRSLRKVVAA